MKRFFAFWLAIFMLFCLAACNTNHMSDIDDTSGNTYQSESNHESESIATHNTKSTENTNDVKTSYSPDHSSKESKQSSGEPQAVFDIQNIAHITILTRHGSGNEFQVPSNYMAEIINWLGSFTTDSIIQEDELIPPGTNFYHVKIEYSDGTVVEKGLDTTNIDGISYYTKSADTPECFYEILSIPDVNKTSSD